MSKPELKRTYWSTWFVISALAVAASCNLKSALAQPSRQNSSISKTGFAIPTFGGTQYWSDIRVTGGWKIQRNAVMDRYRLLDSKDARRAIGDLATCTEALEENLSDGTIKSTKGKVVILLHGLLRSNDSMAKLADYLKTKGGYEVINLAYASSMASIDVHATDLRKVIEGLDPEISEINFVAHSMGNIVVRRYLKTIENAPDPRFHRMVMLAPPNQGSEKARNLSRSTRLFEKVAGPSGRQLGLEWNQLAPNLATPKFEFGIMIGAHENDKLNNEKRTVPGEGRLTGMEVPQALSEVTSFQPHDFTVSVAEAKLPGASDFMVGSYYHWNIKYHPTAMKQTLYFLTHGRFDHVPPNAFDLPPQRTLDR